MLSTLSEKTKPKSLRCGVDSREYISVKYMSFLVKGQVQFDKFCLSSDRVKYYPLLSSASNSKVKCVDVCRCVR